MSYILDALRRADAERERGEVPGLQSQQHAMLDDDAVRPRSQALVWVIVALTLALAAALAWNFTAGEPPRSSPLVEAPRSSVVATAPALAPVLAPPLLSVPSVPSPPAATAAPALLPARPTAPVSAAAPTLASAARAAEARSAARRAAAAPAAARTGDDTPPRLPASAADTRVYAQAELPDTIRRELPKVTIGGASYSGDKASRMVIINGQVFHEGDTIATGLVLQQIKLKAAVLAYKGWRYQIDF